MRTTRLWTALAMASVLAACTDSQGPDGRGTATVSLVTPNSDDGAVSVTLRGTGFSDVQPASSAYLVYWMLASTDEVRVIVIGDLIAGPLFTVGVSDVGRLDELESAVTDAASRLDSARTNTSGYSVSVEAN